MEQIDYKALGQRIRKARQQRHITQEKLGELCALSTAHIGHIERGTRVPSLDTLVRIAEELDVSLDALLLDSVSHKESVLQAASAGLSGKNEAQVKAFLSAVKALSDSIDRL